MLKTCTGKISIEKLASLVRKDLGADCLDDETVLQCCEKAVFSDKTCSLLSFEKKLFIIRQVFCTLRCELEILQDLADDPEVTEIMVNGCEKIFVEKKSKTTLTSLSFENPKHLEQVIQRLCSKVGREFNDLHPIVDARLKDGSRINAVHESLALEGPILTIRKFSASKMSMKDLIANKDISQKAAELLKLLVRCGYNIFISGGTSSGKTTFLNILSDWIPKNERVIVIEDSAELQIRGHENLVRMESKAANTQGKGQVNIRDLIKSSLRMRPDRIIVGEVRGAEVVDMLSAMSTGHDGSLSTGHANSCIGMLGRLETMALSGCQLPSNVIRSQIAEAIDIFVHLARTPDGHRRVIEISEISGIERENFSLNTLYRYQNDKGLISTGNELLHKEKLLLKGGEKALEELRNLQAQ